TKISGQWFMAYQYGMNDTVDFNKFLLRRAYLTFKTKLTKNLSARLTQDLTIDNQGDDAGNVEVRFKYLYLCHTLPDFSIFSDLHFEFGIVHRPWLDFEEHINAYRVQGSMAMEKDGLFNSAGFGISFFTLIGKKMDNNFTKTVNSHYAGQYGSFSLGVYNGGGYHAFEKNASKDIETRLTLRPFPEKLPGLQLSYFGIFGKGNIPEQPDFLLHTGFLSFENKLLILTGQYFTGIGNSKGSLLADTLFNADAFTGCSGFAELKIPKTKLAAFFRYDHFETDKTNTSKQIIIGGFSYRFAKKSKVLIDFENQDIGDKKNHYFAEIALEVYF
ncbi:MAG: hypothetical protein DRP35_11115, partial [Candidatus Zixiibacteriota bacterium]